MKGGYVLITPARNEANFIRRTIEAVAAQSVLPKQWVIVSDDSTDDTDSIVRGLASKHPFITFVRRSGESTWSYGSKVRAIWAGIDALSVKNYDFIGILDADVTFERNYYESVLSEFDRNPKLGIAGGFVLELGERPFVPPHHFTRCVRGAIQLFRRECYERVGGLRPFRHGGEDTAALEIALILGWEVRTLPHLFVRHHRRAGTATKGILAARFREGREDHNLGYHVLYELGKCLRRIPEKPYLAGSMSRLAGYLWSSVTREQLEMPGEFVARLRSQQLRRLLRRLETART
jgi:poly-beta-1,6-N-acetyl-D-glucosamine synthase